MGALLSFIYGVIAYGGAVTTLLVLIGFAGNFVVAKSVDSGALAPTAEAVAIDLLLLCVFAVQHSVMARQGFKRGSTRIVPAAIERSTYVASAGLALALLMWQWRPIPSPIVWRVDHPVAAWATPLMSAGHLLLSIGLTSYVLAGVWFEERDLIAHFGERYRRYRDEVGMLIPNLRTSRHSDAPKIEGRGKVG